MTHEEGPSTPHLRGGLPPHRHRRNVWQREAGRRSGVRIGARPLWRSSLTSKLNNGFHARDAAPAAFDGTHGGTGSRLPRLRASIHWPLPTISDFVETWKAMAVLSAGTGEGDRRLQLPGVLLHLQRDCSMRRASCPVVNQIEVHLYSAQDTCVHSTRPGMASRPRLMVTDRPGQGTDDCRSLSRSAEKVGKRLLRR
jgi:hypothetical protein